MMLASQKSTLSHCSQTEKELKYFKGLYGREVFRKKSLESKLTNEIIENLENQLKIERLKEKL
jgi:hypothetical protein